MELFKVFRLKNRKSSSLDPLVKSENETTMNSFMTPEQMIAMSKTLGDPLIIEEIIKSLKFSDLKSYSKVNKLWNRISRIQISSMDFHPIEFQFNSNECGHFHIQKRPLVIHPHECSRVSTSSTYSSNQPASNSESFLTDFQKILEKSSNFPRSHFIFNGGNGDLAEQEILNFFKIYGTQILHLELVKGTTTCKETLKNILTELAPNLIQLKLVNFIWDDQNEQDFFELPALKMYHWSSDNGNGPGSSTDIEILNNAPNLDTLVGFKLKNFNELKVEQPVLWMSHVKKFHCDRHDNPIDLAAFLHAGLLKLHHLQFEIRGRFHPSHHVELLELFVQLLERNRKSLRTLELGELCSYLTSDVFLPKFSKLTHLKLGGLSSRDGRCFPQKTSLSQTFPYLKVLDCSHLRCHEDSRWWLRYFPNHDSIQGNFDSVESLIIPGDSTELWCRRFSDLCPNFNKLIICSQGVVKSSLFKSVFKLWCHLRELEVQMQIWHNLDCILMGMSKKNVNRLTRAGTSEMSVLFQRCEIGRSIRDLPGLRRLKISVPSPLTLISVESMTMTHSTGLFARHFSPNLKLIVEYDPTLLSPKVDEKIISARTGPFINLHQRKDWID